MTSDTSEAGLQVLHPGRGPGRWGVGGAGPRRPAVEEPGDAMRRAPRAGARLTHCVQVSSEELLDQVLALADGRTADHAGEDAGHGAPLLGDHARRGDA